jgi:hypothetical protein
MKIYGTWGPFDAPYVRAILACSSFNIRAPITFLIDSGASRTTILDSDVVRLGIAYLKLERFTQGTTGIGGVVDTFILPEVTLTFRTSNDIYQEHFDKIFVLRHSIKDKGTEERIKKLPSLLGRDFINKYELVLNRKSSLVSFTHE